jgi:hypothetical protein
MLSYWTNYIVRTVSKARKKENCSCEIWGLHGCDYEECLLLACKNPVRASQERHYVSAAEPSRLTLCQIWDFHSVTKKNVVFWDVTSLAHQGVKNQQARNNVSSNYQECGWFKLYAKSRKILGSNPDEVIENFQFTYPSSSTTKLGYTQPLTEMNTTAICGSTFQTIWASLRFTTLDRLCGLMVRLPGCRPRGLEFDSGRCQIFWVAVGLGSTQPLWG